MDPFRDELAAAHAKIATLEEQVRKMREPPHSQAVPRPPATSAKLIVAVAVIGLGVGIGVAFRLSSALRSATVPSPSATFPGIAIAPSAQTVTTVAAVPTSAAQWTPSGKTSAKPPCNCTPGDPLCSCL